VIEPDTTSVLRLPEASAEMIADDRLYVRPFVEIFRPGKRLRNAFWTSGLSSYQSHTTSLPPSVVFAFSYSLSRFSSIVGQ
jgi:hypothetical protein